MNSKERVRRAVAFKEVDRVPAGLFGTPTYYEEGLAKYIGTGSIEEMYCALGVDIWHCKFGLKYVDDTPNPPQNYAGITKLPFEYVYTVDEVEAYEFPDISKFDAAELAKEIEEHQQFAVCGGINSAIFHHYLWMCGQENALCYLKSQPDVAKAIIRRITDFFVEYLKKVLEAGRGKIDIIENCNDFGTQRSMFISPDDFREFFKPQLKRLYDTAKEYGVMYMQHSCGAIAPIIPDFIEMGADILNPIQVMADGMDIERLAKEYKGKITFYGGIDTQHLLPEGPEERIREEARKTVGYFDKEGGYILSGSQGLLDDIPYSHAVAMLEENMSA
ncbi:uroporphyrinogen decarboxylase family protein [Mahella australiensis]|nr:uroporphyrinogen decarboxylase family protein [Mahella australiensis]